MQRDFERSIYERYPPGDDAGDYVRTEDHERLLAAKEAELRADRGQEYRLQQQHIDTLKEEIESLKFAVRDLQNGLTSKEAELREANAQLTDERKQHALADGKRANRIAALDEQLAEANARTEEQKNGWGVAFKRAAQLQDEVKAERKAREEAERNVRDWIDDNGPGGWIDRMRREVERLRPFESLATALQAKAEDLTRHADALAKGWTIVSHHKPAAVVAYDQWKAEQEGNS